MGRRLQARRGDAEKRILARLTAAYLAVFATVVAALSILAYAYVAANYRSIVAPALETPEGRAGFAAAMRPALGAILAIDAALLVFVGVASYALARAAIRPLVLAREREERFTADVAHELRTPLGVIASLAQSEAGATQGSVRAALETIARRALDAGTLIGDLLTLARTSDAQGLVTEPVDLAVLAEAVVRDARAETPGIAIEGRFASAIVDGDARRLAQLVRNLLHNAQRYAYERVTLTVETREGSALVSVEDDGPGVAPEVVPRLFERFAKSATSPGSGLGLAICRWVARAHDGDVAFAGGSRFVVRLPLART
ncbi:MAG: sensor histidine kinase [Vulcanimicrobiaceae bacterium]